MIGSIQTGFTIRIASSLILSLVTTTNIMFCSFFQAYVDKHVAKGGGQICHKEKYFEIDLGGGKFSANIGGDKIFSMTFP